MKNREKIDEQRVRIPISTSEGRSKKELGRLSTYAFFQTGGEHKLNPKSIFALCRSNRILMINCLSEDAERHMTVHALLRPNALRQLKPSQQTKVFLLKWTSKNPFFCFLLHATNLFFLSYFLQLWDFKVMPSSYFSSFCYKKNEKFSI